MYKLRKKYRNRLIIIVGVIGLGVIAFSIKHFFIKEDIEFVKDNNIEINNVVDAMSFVKNTNGCERTDIKVDISKVKMNQLGEYPITYKVNDKEYVYTIEVVDTVKPLFDVDKIELEVGCQADPKDFVKNIKDSTKTTVSWKKEYQFKKEGNQKVTIVVEDEAGNKSEKTVNAIIVKDEEKPTLSGLTPLLIMQNGKPNYESGLSVKDNRDPHPQLKVDASAVKLDTIGEYNIKYTVTDRSGNSQNYERKAKVVDKEAMRYIAPNDQKIVYLTFDDGPSENTKKIIDILDKYDAKATFFVTGRGQKYNKYIKEAYEKGHTIGLHTYSHEYDKLYASKKAYFDDLTKVGNMVKEEIGFVPRYIRFPGGASNTTSKKYTKGIMSELVNDVIDQGYQYYDWNADCEDASGNNIAVSRLIKAGTSSKANNIMMLAHDTQAKSTTVEALPKIIEHYKKLGYTFKGIDDSTFTPHHKVNN